MVLQSNAVIRVCLSQRKGGSVPFNNVFEDSPTGLSHGRWGTPTVRRLGVGPQCIFLRVSPRCFFFSFKRVRGLHNGEGSPSPLRNQRASLVLFYLV